jgi:hypothetical protein
MRISVACRNQRAFVASQNFSATSLDANRAVGVIVADPAILAQLVSVAHSDWSAAQANE